MVRYYVDTCIWIDYWENRTDGLRPLGEFAFQFFQRVNRNDDDIIISDVVMRELFKFYSLETIKEILSVVSGLIIVHATPEETNHAQIRSKALNIPLGDALHQIIAKREHAIIVTRDKHFDERRTPEEL